MWPNPFTSSPRKERCGDGPKMNGRLSKNSKGLITSIPHPRTAQPDVPFRWRQMLLAIPQEQFYPSYARTTNGTW